MGQGAHVLRFRYARDLFEETQARVVAARAQLMAQRAGRYINTALVQSHNGAHGAGGGEAFLFLFESRLQRVGAAAPVELRVCESREQQLANSRDYKEAVP